MSTSVTAVISTKDRYTTTLPSLLISLGMQTVKPDHIIIYDDGEQKDLRGIPFYQNIFSFIQHCKGISWEVKFGDRKGQVANHQRSIQDAQTEWIWRLDDDNICEATTLENLLKAGESRDVGAVAGLVLDPKFNQNFNHLASNKMEDIFLGLNIQWFHWTGVQEVDHLYSTFLYRKEAAAHGYCKELSRIGHREETIFTHEMKRKGWKLLVTSDAVTWHFRESTGGIRSDSHAEMWHDDDKIFKKKLEEWEIKPRDIKLIVMDNGIGDHLIFKKIIPDLKAKYKDIVMSVCFPEVFETDGIPLISIAEAKQMMNIDELNIYKFMGDNKWTASIENAFRKLYNI
jgi:GT2 family glycosyltransferase